MEPLIDLVNGLAVLNPFLKLHGFEFDSYENFKGSGGQVTVATYKNGAKKFIIGFRDSIGKVIYQFGSFLVTHAYYLDQLGFAEKKQFPDFQSDDKLLAFKHILHDFEYLLEDYFNGSCDKLKGFSVLECKLVEEQNEQGQEEYKYHFDKLTIEQARNKFREKDFKKCLEIYHTVQYETLYSEFDKKAIEYCKQHS